VPGSNASVQTAWWDRHTDRIAHAAGELHTHRILQRLWDHDAGLWSADPTVQASIRKRLGWLSICGVMASKTQTLRRVAEDLHGAGFTHALLLGMGGSALFAEVSRHTFGVAPGHLDLTVLDTTDPTAIRAHRRISLERLCVIVSSKSGSTSETSALAAYFYDAFTQGAAVPGAHCLAITDADTPLAARAQALGFRHILTHGAGTGAEVGGRFSALTYFGLAPAALLGVDLDRLVRRAEEMFTRCGPGTALDDNPAVQLGAALGALAQGGQDKLTLLCAPELASFGTWVEQLIAESLSKQGRGITPIHGEPWREVSAYASDRFFVELQLATHPDAALDARVQGLIAGGHPVLRVRWQDPYDVGGEVAKWFIAAALAGHLLGINPFDEPNVQESKDRTKALLEQYARERRFREEAPACQEAQLAVYSGDRERRGGGSAGPLSLAQCLGAFFQRLRPGDYVAVLSFLPRTPALDRAALTLRERIGERLGVATMLQVGPRYLHSTGQLYKGGPDGGLFLLLTAEEREDLPIPGEPFTFGALKRSQALGDFQAMQQRGRRILRLHLRGDPDQAVNQLLRLVEEACNAVQPPGVGRES